MHSILLNIKLFFLFLSLFIKRLFTKKSFLLILCLLPVFSLCMKYYSKDTRIQYTIAVCNNDFGTLGKEVCDTLTTEKDAIVFQFVSSVREVKTLVQSKKCQGGIVFPEDFSENVMALNLSQCVDAYYYPTNSNILSHSTEFVYARIFRIYEYYKLADYIESKQYISYSPSEIEALHKTLYDMYYNELASEHVVFQTVFADNSTMDTETVISSYLLHSVQGIAALFILLGGMAGTLNLFADKQRKLFYSLPKSMRIISQFSEIFAAVFFTGISGFLTLYFCEDYGSLTILALRLLGYCLICTIYCYVLHLILRSPHIFAASIPVLVLGSLITCPILIDLGTIIRPVRILKWLFAPAYFL